MRVGPERRRSTEELMLPNCAGKDSWDSKEINQSIFKEINCEYSLEGLTLKLKLQSFGHLMQRVDPLEKTLMLGKIKGRRRGDDRGWGGWMASLTQWTWVWANSGIRWRTRKPGVLQSMGVAKSYTHMTEKNWTKTTTNWSLMTQNPHYS